MLTASPSVGTVGEIMTLTCSSPYDLSQRYIHWYRNGEFFAQMSLLDTPCSLVLPASGYRYSYTCNIKGSLLTAYVTIPTVNMTEYEQNTSWQCRTISGSYSNYVTLFVKGLFMTLYVIVAFRF